MNIALIGYGKMGMAIDKLAQERGHHITHRIDGPDKLPLLQEKENIDAAIEFTSPDAATDNIEFLLNNGIPVVSGTTGWYHNLEKIKRTCREKEGTFFHASNFSLGVNILFELNRKLAGIMAGFQDYQAQIEEIHHIHKKDIPSGTAISLAEDILDTSTAYNGWTVDEADGKGKLYIRALREDEVPGTHHVSYESAVDNITISHVAKSRLGFALGAVLAAEFIQNRKGIFTMRDMLKF